MNFAFKLFFVFSRTNVYGLYKTLNFQVRKTDCIVKEGREKIVGLLDHKATPNIHDNQKKNTNNKSLAYYTKSLNQVPHTFWPYITAFFFWSDRHIENYEITLNKKPCS